ncbi:hypothetical protein [Microvirga ossetica]|nr:hypothetical protein [Microvirga ossetica]
MTKSYSLDLRQRVVRFVEAGHSCHVVLLRKNGELLMKQEDLHAEDPF